MQHNDNFSDLTFDDDFLFRRIRWNPDLCPRFSFWVYLHGFRSPAATVGSPLKPQGGRSNRRSRCGANRGARRSTAAESAAGDKASAGSPHACRVLFWPSWAFQLSAARPTSVSSFQNFPAHQDSALCPSVEFLQLDLALGNLETSPHLTYNFQDVVSCFWKFLKTNNMRKCTAYCTFSGMSCRECLFTLMPARNSTPGSQTF